MSATSNLTGCDDTGNRRGEDNAVNAEFQYKYDNEEVSEHEKVQSRIGWVACFRV